MIFVIHKNRCNRRYVREKSIKHKEEILKFKDILNFVGNNGHNVLGKLSKGKVHCSCGLCNNKSFRIVVNRHSYPYHGIHNLSRRDKRALEVNKSKILETEGYI